MKERPMNRILLSQETFKVSLIASKQNPSARVTVVGLNPGECDFPFERVRDIDSILTLGMETVWI